MQYTSQFLLCKRSFSSLFFNKRFRVEFLWFLIALSVRQGNWRGDGGPPVSVHLVSLQYDRVLRGAERAVLPGGDELTDPPEPARLTRPARSAVAYGGPIAWPVLVHQPHQRLVLSRAPRAPHHASAGNSSISLSKRFFPVFDSLGFH